jgi:hypothetical protein
MRWSERQYQDFRRRRLRHEEQAGRIVWWRFEAIKLRLADATF